MTAADATAQGAAGTSATVPDEKRIRSLAGRIKRFRSGPAPITVPESTATAQPATADQSSGAAQPSAASRNGVTEVAMPTPGNVRP